MFTCTCSCEQETLNRVSLQEKEGVGPLSRINEESKK